MLHLYTCIYLEGELNAYIIVSVLGRGNACSFQNGLTQLCVCPLKEEHNDVYTVSCPSVLDFIIIIIRTLAAGNAFSRYVLQCATTGC